MSRDKLTDLMSGDGWEIIVARKKWAARRRLPLSIAILRRASLRRRLADLLEEMIEEVQAAHRSQP